MNKNAIVAAAFCWAVAAVPPTARGSAELAGFWSSELGLGEMSGPEPSPERRASIPRRNPLPDVSAGTDGRELFDGSEARGPTAPSVPAPAVAAAFGPDAGVDQGVAGAAGTGLRSVLPARETAVPAPAAGDGSRRVGSKRGFCDGSFREFDQSVGKVPVLRELLSIILQPVVVYCNLAN